MKTFNAKANIFAMLGSKLNTFLMKRKMFAIISKQCEIFYAIIRTIVVNVVNYLVMCKQSAKMVFHDKSMFHYLPPTIYVWMVRVIDKDISKATLCTASFPQATFRTFILGTFRNTHTSIRAIFSFNPFLMGHINLFGEFIAAYMTHFCFHKEIIAGIQYESKREIKYL